MERHRHSSMDTTAALWLEIDQLHLKYLRHEDNVAKVEEAWLKTAVTGHEILMLWIC